VCRTRACPVVKSACTTSRLAANTGRPATALALTCRQGCSLLEHSEPNAPLSRSLVVWKHPAFLSSGGTQAGNRKAVVMDDLNTRHLRFDLEPKELVRLP
jgi:hypothetical protein